jgi:methionyl-tRNA formyltransferase
MTFADMVAERLSMAMVEARGRDCRLLEIENVRLESAALRLAVILDNNAMARWHLEALSAAGGHEVVLILNCTNTRTRKRPVKHGAYYALNLLSIRNPRSARVPLPEAFAPGAPRITFASEYRGAWQILPAAVIEAIREQRVDAIVKLGMSLMVVPEHDALPVPILSFHHGDPDFYRGRPAGFYELLHGRETMGIIVQILSNQLDAGKVIAFAESKIFPWSYRQTMMEAYRVSPLLLRQALRNLENGTVIEKKSNGPNYRLPSNALVARFVLKMLWRTIARYLYGAFVEKKWQVAMVVNGEERRVPISKRYSFYADPFLVDGETLVVEAMSKTTGKGELLLIRGSKEVALTDGTSHYSYPDVVGETLLLPEIAAWSTPRLFRLEHDALVPFAELEIEGDPRVIDPTLYADASGHHYLFGSDRQHGANVLWLWHSPSLTGPYRLHPASPIRISPRGSRMGGALMQRDGRLYRFGQNDSGSYGDGLFEFEVTAIDPSTYREELVREIRLEGRRGPHTLNARGERTCFDWYVERFSLLAGYRRLLGRRSGG